MQNHPSGPITSPKHSSQMAKEHGGLHIPAPASLALESRQSLLPLVCFFKHCRKLFRSTGCLLRASADVQVILLLPEFREGKPLLKSKCQQDNKESWSDSKGLCLSLLKVMSTPKTQMSVVCWCGRTRVTPIGITITWLEAWPFQ